MAFFGGKHILNQDISSMPVHPMSATWVEAIGAGQANNGNLFCNVGGMPVTYISRGQPFVAVHPTTYPNQSDSGFAPIPPVASVQFGSDAHVIIYDEYENMAYELWQASIQGDNSWNCGSYAVWRGDSLNLRPQGWGSADAAGMPIFAGIIRYDEVERGLIDHALRLIVPSMSGSFQWPARAATAGPVGVAANNPPAGAWFRLQASVNVFALGLTPVQIIIAQALQKYGCFVCDNYGAPTETWGIMCDGDSRWSATDLPGQITAITGNMFEAVDISSLMLSVNSAEAR